MRTKNGTKAPTGHANRDWGMSGCRVALALCCAVVVLSAAGLASCGGEDRALLSQENLEWCQSEGGEFKWQTKEGFFSHVSDACTIPAPSQSAPSLQTVIPEDCYTPAADAPESVPRNVNWYAYYLLGKGGAGAGGLDKYEHCKDFPVVRDEVQP